ncbi:MAG: RDD family protein, partial [Chromatiales bacterium]
SEHAKQKAWFLLCFIFNGLQPSKMAAHPCAAGTSDLIRGSLDTAQAVETPEGVSLDLHVAGPVARLFAFALDLLIRTAAYVAMGQILPSAGEFGFGIYLIAVFAIEWFYAVPFEVLWCGQTPGKRALKIRVANLREASIGALLREEVQSFADALGVAAAHRYLAARRQAHQGLAAHGALSIDVEPGRLSVQLVNRYLEIKRSGRL